MPSASNNPNVGAGYIERNGQQYLVRVPGQVDGSRRAARDRARSREGVPIRVGDVADGRRGHGAAHRRGDAERREVVLGTVFMLIGENSRDGRAARRRERARARCNRACRRASRSTPVYDRTDAGRSHDRDGRRRICIEGALLVIVVLFVLLGNLRAALITAAVIPLAMLMTLTGMVRGGVSGNLMSLGALDFGLIVDGAVIIVENCLRRFGEAQQRLGRVLTRDERFELTATATARGDPPEPVRCRDHRGRLPADLRVDRHRRKDVPPDGDHGGAGAHRCDGAVADLRARGGRAVPRRARAARTRTASLRGLDASTSPLLRVVACARACRGRRRRGCCSSRVRRCWPPAWARSSSRASTKATSRCTRCAFPARASLRRSRCRRARSAHQAVSRSGTRLRARSAPRKSRPIRCRLGRGHFHHPEAARAVARSAQAARPQLVAEIEDAVEALPGNNYEFTQPIQMRMNELISGVRADVAVKVFGDDLDDTGAAVASDRARSRARFRARRT